MTIAVSAIAEAAIAAPASKAARTPPSKRVTIARPDATTTAERR